MSHMSEIDIARQNGEPFTMHRCADGVIQLVCTGCLAGTRTGLLDIEHSDHCKNMSYAAAPELLDALKAMVEMHGGSHDTNCPCDDTCHCSYKDLNDQINAAINKAEGRTNHGPMA